MTLILNPGAISLAELRAIWDGAPVALADESWAAIDAAATAIGRILESGRTVYGVNTGFGILAQTRIPPERLAELQRNLILSHSCGLGEPLDPKIVRLAMVLKAAGIARGHSGVRRELVELLLALVAADAVPVIPGQGSVGASGDLAPLAHMGAALLGEGELALDGKPLHASEALKYLGLEPLTLAPKEGLALINGTQVSTAIALDTLFTAERVFAAALAGRRDVDRRAQGHRRAVRLAHPRRARPARPDRGRGGAARPARGQRDPRLARRLRRRSRIPTATAASRR